MADECSPQGLQALDKCGSMEEVDLVCGVEEFAGGQAELDEEARRQAQLHDFAAMKKARFMQGVTANLTAVNESTDKRVRRIENSRIFTKGVSDYRTRTLALEPPVNEITDELQSRVFVRARPLFEHEAARGEWDCVSSCGRGVTVHEGCEKVRPNKGHVKVLRHHGFEQVQRIDSDEGVYKQLQYLVQRACAGQLATLFMYGMTGSGKTYSTNLMFHAAPTELVALGSVSLIAFELVGKRCFDLLGATKQEVYLRIGEDGATHVQGTNRREAHSAEELQALLHEASSQRETAPTGTNATSSRSHAVYQLSTANGGTLMIVDLAGNEGNIETHHHSKELMKEAAEINTSLMVLRTCLAARASGKAHVPYRESALTRVLRDSFIQGSAGTAVLCCVSPACSHMERTLITLQSAVNLTTQVKVTQPVDEELQEKGVLKGGPTTWDSEAVLSWIEQQELRAKVALPAGMNGQQIMKLTAARLAPLCGGDTEIAKLLFDALRVASKDAAANDRELRRAMKAGPKPTSSIGFSKPAQSQPSH